MKRIISCLLVVVLLAAVIPASAAAETELVFSAPYAVVGETLTLSISAKNLPKCAGYGIFLKYDQEKLKLTHFKHEQAGDGTNTNELTEEDFGEENLIIVGENQANFANIKLDGFEGANCPLATLKFKVLSRPENGLLTFDILRGSDKTMFSDTNEPPNEIEFSFDPIQVPIYNNHPFTDVGNGWEKESVLFAYNNNLMNGVGGNKFGPSVTTNRAMLVTILYRYEGEPFVPAASPFTDLNADWYKNAVNWAFEKAIVNGMTATTFAPDGEITREQIATMMYRYAEYKGADLSQRENLTSFSDCNKVSPYAKAAMEWAYAKGLITGNKINNKILLDPQGEATRAQIATILMRYIKAAAEE